MKKYNIGLSLLVVLTVVGLFLSITSKNYQMVVVMTSSLSIFISMLMNLTIRSKTTNIISNAITGFVLGLIIYMCINSGFISIYPLFLALSIKEWMFFMPEQKN